MGSHYVVKCRECLKVLSQCRCPAKDKEVRWGQCGGCGDNVQGDGIDSWTDKSGACKICQGEIPYGHALTCYIYKMQHKLQQCQEAFNDLEAASSAWEGTANQWKEEHDKQKAEAARLQLVAGRYQFMWEAAQLCLNKIDDWFEYAHKICTPEQAQAHVRQHLAIYTEAVSELVKRNKK